MRPHRRVCGSRPNGETAVFSKFSDVLLERLDTAVTGEGSGKSLAGKIELAQTYLAVPDVESACAVLNAFLNQVSAQRDKKLSVELADRKWH